MRAFVALVGLAVGCGGSSSKPDAGGTDATDDADAAIDSASLPDASGVVVIAGDKWPDSATATCAGTTGAIACPTSGEALYGQDGTYRVAVPSYTVTADTVADSVTSLIWQRASNTAKTQALAAAECDALALGGQTDWRLPTRLELASLLDHGRTTGGALPAAFGLPSTGGAYWTSSTTARIAGAFFVVNLNFGLVSAAVATNTLISRCVRGDAFAGAKQANTDTVVDAMTGLEWARSALVDTEVTWAAALAYCEALVHAGHSDWRLPNIKELATIVDEADATAPAIDQTLFGTSAATFYWSSSPTLLSPGFAATLQTDVGGSPNRDMTMTASARCVRQAAL
jgi:hypothetical protein